tara:strand:- start:1160 stop:2176 length:1017 start_codon:yes stop_codon:yes gene_type:complete
MCFEQSKRLLKDGVIVVDTFLSKNPESLDRYHRRFLDTLKSQPEFNEYAIKNKLYVMGGFSGLGNASSFHNPFVREIRAILYYDLYKEIFGYILQELGGNYKFEQHFDRMMYRLSGVKPCSETFHRDESQGDLEDITFGGWLNISFVEENFSCVKFSHVLDSEQKTQKGFNKFSKDQQKEFKAKSELVPIKPGQAIIFVENIIHEVLATAVMVDRCRLFIGFSITKRDAPLIAELESLIENQAIIPLKSGQIPPIYSPMHLCNHHEKLVDFTNGIKDFIKVNHTFKSGKKQGITIKICPRYMPSLKEISKLAGKNVLYEPYCIEEINMYRPMKMKRIE